MEREPDDPLQQNREILALARKVSAEFDQIADALNATLQRIREETTDD